MKKLVNLIAFVVLVSTNVFTPFSYAQDVFPEVIPENEVENVVEVGETPEKDKEITGEIPNSLGEVEGEGSLPLAREVVNETSPAKQGENLEGLKEEVEDSLDDVKTPASDEDKKEDTEKGETDEVAQSEEENAEIEKQEKDLEDNNGTTEKENIKAEIQELQKTQEISTMDTMTNSKDIILEATSTASNQTLKINKYFKNAYTVSRCDGCETLTLSSDTGHTYEEPGTYTITLSLTGSATRWAFQNESKPLVPTNGTTVTDVKIVSMPSLADGFGNSETNPGNYFFNYFNYNGQLTSLPEGSFDTSKITTVGNYFFNYFNFNGELTSLPSGSFDTSKITTVGSNFFNFFNNNGELTSLPGGSFRLSTGLTTVGSYFFNSFNRNGQLTSLPEGSFDTSNITTVGNYFFASFNHSGQLTSLPIGSFDTSNISGTVGDWFFYEFNSSGGLTSLPSGSFNTSNISGAVGSYFFYSFNSNGKLTSLPSGSFDTSKITTVGDSFFNLFNKNGALTSLPIGSFDTSNISGTVGDWFFSFFNESGQLTSLPIGSFDTSNISGTVGDWFFVQFNNKGSLTSLPEGSFDTSNIKIVGDSFFSSFNSNGQLTSLPKGSFDMSNITSASTHFFSFFNFKGAITSLPNSFKLTSAAYNKKDAYYAAFNSSIYTLNKRVSNLTRGITNLSSDQNVFSDNQPGICGVHPNWLLSSYNACKIIYDANGGTGTITGGYNSNATSVVVGAGIKLPSMEGYALSGWYDASGNRVETIIFPDMDGQTLYAQWEECGNGYVVNSTGTSCVLKEYTITYNLGGGYLEDGSGNKHEGNQAITYTYSSTGNKYVADLVWENVKKQDSVFLGWYTASDGGEKVNDITSINIAGETLYAHWNDCESGYTLNNLRTSCVLKEYTITYNLLGGYLEDESGNKYEGNQVVSYTYSSTGNKYMANVKWKNVSRENSKFLGWYTSEGEVFDFGTIPPEENEAYAKYECNLGYAVNEDGVACEKIRVEFDANGGVFSDNDNIFSIIKSKQVLGKIMRTLHTANLDDNDNYTNEFNGQQMNGYTTSIAPYTSGGITTYPISSPSIVYFEEENVEKLDVSIKYGGSPYCTPGYIIVWTGDHRQFDANYNPGNTGLSVLYIGDFPSYGENSEKSVEIKGDGFTIYQNGGCPSYGFFANISRTGILDLIYEDDAFDNIPEPTREGHKFKGWYLSDGSEFNTGNVSTGEVTHVYAKWECADGYENKGGECVKKSSGSSGGGGGGGSGGGSSKDTDKDTHGSAEDSQKNIQDDKENVIQSDPEHSEWGSEESSNTPMDSSDKSSEGQEILSPSDSSFTKEQKDAYTFAKENGITTKDTIQSAQMNGKLTRIAMAKMLSQYAINVLGQTPDTSKTVKFKDVTSKKDADYDNGVTLAYQLGIMGQNMPNNRFRPNDEVSRAEFATALSRLLYQTTDGEYKSTKEYYIPHMAKLYNEGIISNTDPSMAERRGYVMIMLMRSAK